MTRISKAGKALVIMAATLAFGIAPAAAQESAATPKAQAKEAEGEELICRTEKVIGSRAKKRKTCLTKEQWEEVATKGNAFARSLVESGRSGMCGSGADVC